MMMSARSLSSVQNRHANQRLKAILWGNFSEGKSGADGGLRESKSVHRINDPISIDAKNS